MDRREFSKTSSLALGGMAAASISGRKVLGANERIHLGVIGCGGRGRYDTSLFIRNPDVSVDAICDVDRAQIAKMLEEELNDSDSKPEVFGDFRKLLEKREIDAVLIATPDHWHAIPFVTACEAGKDIYCEKPVALTIYEGQRMIEAARKYERVTQIGTQQRSNAHFQEAVQLIQSGYMGKVTHVVCWNVSRRWPEGLGNPPDTDPPDGVDYDMWLGPAPKRPFNKNRFHGVWRWFWDYSGGQTTDWGTHHLDIIQWALGCEYPNNVVMTGGKYAISDNRETPDTQDILWEYEGGTSVHYLHRICSDSGHHGRSYGTEFYGTDAVMFIDRGGYTIRPLDEKTAEKTAEGSDKTDGHINEFLKNIKTRDKCVSDIAVTHRSTSATHLANISLWSGEKIVWDGEKERIVSNSKLNRYLRRKCRKPWKI